MLSGSVLGSWARCCEMLCGDLHRGFPVWILTSTGLTRNVFFFLVI